MGFVWSAWGRRDCTASREYNWRTDRPRTLETVYVVASPFDRVGRSSWLCLHWRPPESSALSMTSDDGLILDSSWNRNKLFFVSSRGLLIATYLRTGVRAYEPRFRMSHARYCTSEAPIVRS